MKDFFKKLITSVVVVIFMAIFSILVPQPKLLHFVALLFVVLLAYYLGLPALSKIATYLKVKARKKYPKIGVLNGNIESPVREYKCQHSGTDVTADMWFATLKRELGIKRIEMITTSKINDSFSIIVSPFGDAFPEEDLKLHSTFYKICDFIANGGLFLCTGCAFWAHQNTKVSEAPEWVFVKTQEGIQSLRDSFLYKEFGVVVTGDVLADKNSPLTEPVEIEAYQKDEDVGYIGTLVEGDTRIRRFRALTSESSNYIPLLREKEDASFPLAVVRYGKGYLVHAGMFLTGVKTIEFNILIKAVRDIISNEFARF
jgi:hypothetical protein